MCWSELAILFHSSSWVSPLRLQWCLTAWIWTSYYRIPFLSFFFSPLTVKIIKLERDFLDEHLGTEWGEMGFKLEEGRFKTDTRNKLYTYILYKCGRWLELVAQWSYAYPLLGGSQGQVGWSCEQPGLEGGVPAYRRGLELEDLKCLLQSKPFYDSMTYHNEHQPLQKSIQFERYLFYFIF